MLRRGTSSSMGVFIRSCRMVNQWTNDPIQRAKMKKKSSPKSLGNSLLTEEAEKFPARPIEHSQSPYIIEHPSGIPSSFLDANKLKDNPGARHSRKIVGRGPGSGLGKTCGKGTKGQRSRSGMVYLSSLF